MGRFNRKFFRGSAKRRTFRRKRMPFRKRRRRTFRRRRRVPWSTPWTQQVLFRKHRYAERITLTPSIATPVAKYQFSGNSLFDPDITSGGHQPRGYDEFKARFSRWRVMASSIKVRPTPVPDAVADKWILKVIASDNASTANIDTPIDLQEMGGGYSLIYRGNEPHTIKRYQRTRRMINARALDNANTGTSNANPPEQWNWNIYVGPTNTGLEPGSLELLVEITYYAQWFDPIWQVVS